MLVRGNSLAKSMSHYLIEQIGSLSNVEVRTQTEAVGAEGDGWPLQRDPFPLETSVPSVFVAGDVRARSIKRVASAVGEGSMAVSLVHQYLAEA